MDATIYHNPKCSTSRKALQALRDAGIEPTVVKYLDEPYTREQLVKLFADAGPVSYTHLTLPTILRV